MGAKNDVIAYVARFPFAVEREEVFPKLRAEEIASCGDTHVRDSKYYVWKLLERAARETFGLDIATLAFTVNNGKWSCPDFHFSLSHSGNLVAVALSKSPVGVDIERKNEARFDEKLRKKILTPREAEEEKRLSEGERAAWANELWTKKEAIFKLRGAAAFLPANIETDTPTHTVHIDTPDGAYILTAAGEHGFKLKLIQQ